MVGYIKKYFLLIIYLITKVTGIFLKMKVINTLKNLKETLIKNKNYGDNNSI